MYAYSTFWSVETTTSALMEDMGLGMHIKESTNFAMPSSKTGFADSYFDDKCNKTWL
jgi:hypothetical protein